MDRMVRTKIIKIGNSRGIRIPRAFIEQAGFEDEVAMKVENNRLIIHAIHTPRAGWKEQYAAMHECGDDHLLDELTQTQWDEEEWTW